MTARTRAAAQRSASPPSLQPDAIISPRRLRRNSPDKASSSPSDGEGRTRPTRKKLEQTSIAGPGVVSEAMEHDTEAEKDVISEAGSAVREPKNDTSPATNGNRGRIRRKRSFEELAEEQDPDRLPANGPKHLRKRSRDVRNGKSDANGETSSSRASLELEEAPEGPFPTSDAAGSNGNASSQTRPTTPTASEGKDVTLELQKSPQNKRNRDQYIDDVDLPKSSALLDAANASATKIAPSATSTAGLPTDEPESKRHRDSAEFPTLTADDNLAAPKLTTSSGFANIAAQSPFAALSSSKPTSAQPSLAPSAFANSAFGALSSSTQSPFGALSSTVSSTTKETKPLTSFASTASGGFGALGAPGKSSFASPTSTGFGTSSGTGSGFGQLRNGFGSGGGFGGGASKPLSSFASSAGPLGSSSKPAKAFGAPADDEEDGEASGGEEDADAAPRFEESEHKDKRFYEQEVETGEEDETIEFNSRAKLYMTVDKQWKERGIGNLKINSRVLADDPEDDEAPAKLSARFIMRADGTQRIVLNSPITKDIKIEDPTGGLPQGGRALFLGFVDDKPAMLQVKMRGSLQTQELHNVVKRLQRAM